MGYILYPMPLTGATLGRYCTNGGKGPVVSTHDKDLPIGLRIKAHRERAGMSRPVLAGLIGMSAEWLKKVESGRLQPPRLPMLLKIAHALNIKDLAELTENDFAVPVEVFAGERHSALTAVQSALTDFRLEAPDRTASIDHLAARLRQAWQIRHASPDHRTQLGALLPSLIRDAQSAARTTGENRRPARKVLAGVYQLADFYVAYQPAPELVWMVADRALNESYEADDPYVIACSAWGMVQALRDSGRWEEAIALCRAATAPLAPYLERPETADDWRGIAGALEAEVAYVHARRGRSGEAWAAWESAQRTALKLGAGYRHIQTSFSLPVMAAHATTLGVELHHAGEAIRAANTFDADEIVSIPRRSRHLIEAARAHNLRDESVATFALLSKAASVAPETIRYNGFARDMLHQLRAHPPSGMRTDVRKLCELVGVTG